MISVIQVVSHAEVTTPSGQVGTIGRGVVALIGIEQSDTEQEAKKLFERIINYRIFPDSLGKTNLNLHDIEGELLLVSQFTLVADTKKGLRPSFSKAMPPAESKKLFEFLILYAKNNYPYIATGQFGSHMQVNLCNDGPMTFILQVN